MHAEPGVEIVGDDGLERPALVLHGRLRPRPGLRVDQANYFDVPQQPQQLVM